MFLLQWNALDHFNILIFSAETLVLKTFPRIQHSTRLMWQLLFCIYLIIEKKASFSVDMKINLHNGCTLFGMFAIFHKILEH